MSELTKPVKLHFAHANGFPASSYKQLFIHLPEHFDIHGLEVFGHNPQYPVDSHLGNQVLELVDYVKNKVNEPVYAVGHSMGAIVSYMAACEYPQWFKGVIMLDPPIASGVARWMFKLLKKSPWIDKYTPAGKAVIRCQVWPKDADLFEYFKSRQLFANFTDECIHDYVEAGTELRDENRHLVFDAQIEASIYRNVPHNINQYYGKLSQPALLITAENSEVCTDAFLSSFLKHTQLEHKVVAGVGHMFPFEIPKQVADMIRKKIVEWESSLYPNQHE